MFKKILIIITLLIISGAISFASYSAIIENNKSELDAANSLAEKKIIKNNINNPDNYYLNNNVLRQEIALIAKRVAKLETKNKCDNIFSDISENNPNNWACINIEPLVDNDLISKNDNFRPEDNISKSEAVIMLIRAIGFDFKINNNSSENWQKQVVKYAVEKGILENFTDYNTEATRGWIFKLADTTIKKDEEIKKQIKMKKKYSDEAM